MNGNDDLAKTLNEGLQFEETPMPGTPSTPPPIPTPVTPPPAADEDTDKMPTLDPDTGTDDDNLFGAPPTMASTPPTEEPKEREDDKPAPKIEHHGNKNHGKSDSTTKNSELDNIKASALEALRPLVGKLKLPAEERFDTLLLIIRSTDDQALLSQAHDAAKQITDDTRRAQALLDVIKEIDYFSSKR